MESSAAGIRVLVTGSSGFLGQFVCHELKILGCEVIKVCRSTGFNLLSEPETLTAILTAKPQVVIHLAGVTLLPPEEQGASFRDNLKMGMNVLDASLLAGAKFVTVASRSIYAMPAMFSGSKFKAIPETCLHVGPPADAQGDAKRALMMACSRYHAQYKMPYAFLVLAPLYGPMQMSWNFGVGFSTGVGFMVKSILDLSTEPEFAFSGFSGEELIEHLFIGDAAKAIVQAALSLEPTGVVNIASGEATSRQEIDNVIADVIEYKGKIHFDEKPATPMLPLSGELAQKLMDWKPVTPLSEGLRVTVGWYAADRESQELKVEA
jgi:nucleoside-diphosphate-sugar epimerase